MVVEQTSRGELVRHLLAPAEGAHVFLGTPIDDNVGNSIMAQLLHLESGDPDKDIHLYINSPGGVITSLFDLRHDAVHQARRVHDRHGAGRERVPCCCSPGHLASASRSRTPACCCTSRTAAPRARPSTSRSRPRRSPGHASSSMLIAHHTGQPIEKVAKDTDRDFILTAGEAASTEPSTRSSPRAGSPSLLPPGSPARDNALTHIAVFCQTRPVRRRGREADALFGIPTCWKRSSAGRARSRSRS